MEVSRQEHWSGLPLPSPGDLPDPRIKFGSSCTAGTFFTVWTTWEDHGQCPWDTFLKVGWSVSSVAQSCPTLCDPMDCSTPSFPVHHQLLELTQTHVHHISDAIEPSRPLLSPSPPTFNPSQHQGLFLGVSSSHQVVHVLKTLESPLDCKEIQPVNPKGNLSRILIGRTDTEAETLILGLPDAKM